MFEKLQGVEERFLAIEKQLSEPEVVKDRELYQKLILEHAELNKVVSVFKEYKKILQSIEESTELLQDSDPEIKNLAREELADLNQHEDRLEDELRSQSAGRFQVVRSHTWFVEGLAQGVSKGEALSRLARRLGVTRQETMALGDSGNDRAMVEWAGLGVAIGNASADVKAVAELVAPPQEADGAAWAIERYALAPGARAVERD